MATVVINTQVWENYAAHNDNYESGVTPDRWKAKGGHSYKINTTWPADYEWADVYASRIINDVMDGIGESNDYFREEVIGWFIAEDGWLSQFEKSQLECDGKISNPEPVLDYIDLTDDEKESYRAGYA